MPPVDIGYHGIVGLLENIQVHKACGPDGICGTLLKRCAKVAAMFLKSIFVQSLNTGDIPEDWRKALVHPVFKGETQSKLRIIVLSRLPASAASSWNAFWPHPL